MKLRLFFSPLSMLFFLILSLDYIGYAQSYPPSNSINQNNFWTCAGPFSSSVNGFSVNPKNGNMYAVAGSVFTSNDKGENWVRTQWLNSAKCIATNSLGHIYLTSIWSVWQSTDLGISWNRFGIAQAPIQSFMITQKGYIFVGTQNQGLVSSTDRGKNWKSIYLGSLQNGVNVIMEDQSNTLFIGCSQDGLLNSTDDGATWNSTNITNADIRAFAIDAKGIYWAGSFSGVIYNSTDNGYHWRIINQNNIIATITSMFCTRTGVMFVGTLGNGLYRSNDDGTTWISCSSLIGLSQIISIFSDSNEQLFIGTERGAYRSIDDGNSWKVIGISGAESRAIASNSDGSIYTAIYGSGLLFSSNKCETFYAFGMGLPKYPISLGVNSRGNIFVGMNSEGLYRSTNRGDAWEKIGNGLTNNRVVSLAFASDSIVYAGTYDGIFISTNNGDNWFQTDLKGWCTYSILFNSDSMIFAATDGGVYRSTDHGFVWEKIEMGFYYQPILSILITKQNTIYAGTKYRGLFKSTDNGEHWSSVLSPTVNTSVNSLVMNPEGDIFASTGLGVYKSIDGWETYVDVSSGINNSFINRLMIDNSGYLYAATRDNGIYRSMKKITAIKENKISTPSSIFLSQNYPNPFSTSTIIDMRYNSSPTDQSSITLKVYDLFGREVLDLSDHIIGNWKLTIDNSQLPKAGVYIYRLQKGNEMISRKMILIE